MNNISEAADNLLRALQSRPARAGRPKKGEGEQDLRAEAVGLLWECHRCGAAPPMPLVQAIGACLGTTLPGDRPTLNDRQWDALNVELRYFWEGLASGGPWSAPVELVREQAGVSSGQTVRNWRNDENYRHGLYFLAAEVIGETLGAQECDNEPIAAASEPRAQKVQRLIRDARHRWGAPGPMSLFGKEFATPEDLAEHMADQGYEFARSDKFQFYC